MPLELKVVNKYINTLKTNLQIYFVNNATQISVILVTNLTINDHFHNFPNNLTNTYLKNTYLMRKL